MTQYDYLIVGAGIMGLTIAYELKKQNPDCTIAIIEKESDVAFHSSGRNSGILHAGFYYSADSLKAKFTVDGNLRMKNFCQSHNIYVNPTKKIVVAQNQEELEALFELEKRAKINGVQTQIISENELKDLCKNVKTHQFALYSPTTASVNPKEVCQALKKDLLKKNVKFYFDTKFDQQKFKNYDYLINAAGLYADKIAKKFHLAKNYTLLPFKGIYYKYIGDKAPLDINVYPVPNLKNPFLGVHYTITYDNTIKIGPTAIPAFWRENYRAFDNFSLSELAEILYYESKLFSLNSFHFRDLALEEVKNYNKSYFVQKAAKLLHQIDDSFEVIPAGIRAQLLDTNTNQLVMDFVVEQTKNSIHILNAVSPAFTCSFAFAEYIVEKIKKNKEFTK